MSNRFWRPALNHVAAADGLPYPAFAFPTSPRRCGSDAQGANLDRITKITFPDGTFDQIVYNLLDPEVLRDRAGREIKLEHDSLGQLTSVQDAQGRVTRYQWCGCGGLDAVVDPLRRTTSWVRDLQGRVTAKIYSDGSQVRYEYDTATGWLKSVRDEQNQVTLFDRNLDGTLRQKRYLNSLIQTPPVLATRVTNEAFAVETEQTDLAHASEPVRSIHRNTHGVASKLFKYQTAKRLVRRMFEQG